MAQNPGALEEFIRKLSTEKLVGYFFIVFGLTYLASIGLLFSDLYYYTTFGAIYLFLSSIQNLIDSVRGAILIFLGYKVSFRNVSLARLFKDYKKLVGSYLIFWGART